MSESTIKESKTVIDKNKKEKQIKKDEKKAAKKTRIDKVYSLEYQKSYDLFTKILGIITIGLVAFSAISFFIAIPIMDFQYFYPISTIAIIMSLIVWRSEIKDPINHMGKILAIYGIVNFIEFLIIYQIGILYPDSVGIYVARHIMTYIGFNRDLIILWFCLFGLGLFMILYTRSSYLATTTK